MCVSGICHHYFLFINVTIFYLPSLMRTNVRKIRLIEAHLGLFPHHIMFNTTCVVNT